MKIVFIAKKLSNKVSHFLSIALTCAKKLCPEFKLLTCYLSPRRELCPGPGQTTCPEPAGWKTTEILKKEKIKNCQPDQPVQSLTLGQSKVLIPPTKTARIRISLKSVLGVEKKTLLKYSLLF